MGILYQFVCHDHWPMTLHAVLYILHDLKNCISPFTYIRNLWRVFVVLCRSIINANIFLRLMVELCRLHKDRLGWADKCKLALIDYTFILINFSETGNLQSFNHSEMRMLLADQLQLRGLACVATEHDLLRKLTLNINRLSYLLLMNILLMFLFHLWIIRTCT